MGRSSSLVEHTLGKGVVGSSILLCGTTPLIFYGSGWNNKKYCSCGHADSIINAYQPLAKASPKHHKPNP